MRRLAWLALGSLACPLPALAADYVVSPSGDDKGSGAAGSPWKTLQHAADTAIAGDTVTIEDGRYDGFICDKHSGAAGRPIVFRARNRWKAVIDRPIMGVNVVDGIDFTDDILILGQSYITLDGLEVRDAGWRGIDIRSAGSTDGMDTRDNVVQSCHAIHNGLILLSPGRIAGHDGIFSAFAYNITIRDSVAEDNTEHGIYVSNSADNPVIRNNVSHHNMANGIQINADVTDGGDGVITNFRIENNIVYGNHGSAAINLDGAVAGVVQNNLLYDNDKAGITLFRGDAAEASHDDLIANNTIYDPAGSRAALQVADGADNNVVFNNILYSGGGAGLEVQSVTGLVHDFNFVSSYSGATAGPAESMPAIGVLFGNPAAGDFTSPAGSPAIGSGTPMLGGRAAPAADLRGAARPAGGPIDRGAYQSGSEPPPDLGAPPLADGAAPGIDSAAGSGDGGGNLPATSGCGCCLAGRGLHRAPGLAGLLLAVAGAAAYLVRRRRSAQ